MVSSCVRRYGLSGNELKLIAAFSMLVDHIGVILLPECALLRIVGRLAFPIYAFMIAEGCAKTRNKRRYFLSVFALGALCQLVYFLYDGSTYLGILITFSLSILMIYALQDMKETTFAASASRARRCIAWLAFPLLVTAVYLMNRCLTIDYGFWGCMLPVLASVFRRPASLAPSCLDRLDRLGVHVGMLCLGLVILSCDYGGVQPYSLCSVPFLSLYSGLRGAWHMKSFFYIFYPAHLAAITLLAMILA